MNMRKPTIRVLLTFVLLSCFSTAHAEDKPNIVLVFLDNFGWGEPGFNGGSIVNSSQIRFTTPVNMLTTGQNFPISRRESENGSCVDSNQCNKRSDS